MKKIYFTFFFCAFLNFVFGQEYKMKVSSVTSLQKAQSGNEVTRTIDDNMTTMYHSTYGVVGIPDQLDFSFSPRVKSIKSLIYYPRATGSNGVWTNVDVYYSTQADPGNFIKLNDAPLVWALNNTSKRYDFPAAVQNPAVIRVKVNSGAGNFSSCAEMEFYSSEQGMPVSTECNLATSEFDSLKDIAVKPSISGSSASNFQSGQNIEKSFDGDTSTLYHSSWTATTFPIELIYNFDGVTAMDYLRYTSRQDGGINGMFGNIKISYNTISDPTYIPLKTMDFAQGSGVKRVEFGSTITPLNIKIEVLDGRGNFASCAEMEFFRNNPNGFNLSLYSNLFNDTLFSELKSGVTQQDIDAVASPFIKALAQCLFNNTYNKKYRVQTYMPYKTISSINKGYKIGDYNQFEGTLGIVFQQNTTAVIFAKNITESHPVSLRIKDFAAEGSASVDRSYDLKNGINFIPITNNGLGYISYFTDDPNAVPVSVNVTAGIVNGIYKKGTSSTEWKEILANDVYSKVDLEGIYTKLVFTKSALKTYHSDDVQPLIDKYDIIAKSERELMGFFKYNKNFKNRQFIYTENSGGWNAGV